MLDNSHDPRLSNLIDCQIRPLGIKNQDILNAFSNVNRCTFLEKIHHPLAYSDITIKYGNQTLWSPTIIAQVLDQINLITGGRLQQQKVLCEDVGKGYIPAIISTIPMLIDVVATDTENKAILKKHLADYCVAHAVIEQPVLDHHYDVYINESGEYDDSFDIAPIMAIKQQGNIKLIIDGVVTSSWKLENIDNPNGDSFIF